MTDMMDRLITVGMGLEKRAREVLEGLEDVGKEVKKATDEKVEGTEDATTEGEDLSARKKLENRLVDDGVKVMTEFVSLLTECKTKFTGEASSTSETLMEKMNVATRDELEVVKEMARVAREKVDELEKKVETLEKGK